MMLLTATFFSCKQEEIPSLDNPDINSQQIDTTLKSYYPKPSSADFEQIYSYVFPNVNCGFDIDMWWYAPTATNGLRLHFNNSVGDVLIDNNGFVKSFDSGIKIDSTLAGNWSGSSDGILSYDYILYPSADKGNLAGQGDKYIVLRAFSDAIPSLKYYAYLRLRISADGRDVKIISIAYQKNPNTGFNTGEY